MEWMDFAIINAGISLWFVGDAISKRIPAYGAIPNVLGAIGFYILAVI